MCLRNSKALATAGLDSRGPCRLPGTGAARSSRRGRGLDHAVHAQAGHPALSGEARWSNAQIQAQCPVIHVKNVKFLGYVFISTTCTIIKVFFVGVIQVAEKVKTLKAPSTPPFLAVHRLSKALARQALCTQHPPLTASCKPMPCAQGVRATGGKR